MRKWSEINKASILNNRSLLLEFTNNFQDTFKEKLNVGCKNCITDAYNRLVSKQENRMANKKEVKSGYILKAKYSGSIIWNGNPVRRGEITDKLGADLVKNHKAGALLFEKIPEVVIDVNKEDKDRTFKELKEKYPNVKSNSKDGMLAKIAELTPLNNEEEE